MGKTWSQLLRVEDSEHVRLSSSRTINSVLWFVNNKALENHILAYLAKYVQKHSVELYAFVIVGNYVWTRPSMSRSRIICPKVGVGKDAAIYPARC